MARGRIIDREFFSHEQLGELSLKCRYFYLGLIVFADDEGRLKGSPKYLKAKIFPYDEVSENDIKKMVDQLVDQRLLVGYQVETNVYFQHPKWEKWQPIRKDRFKPSDCPSSVDGIPVVNQMATVGIPLPNLTKPNLTTQIDGWFTTFYNQYPKKKAKQDALKAWKNLRPNEELLNKICAAIEVQKKTEDWIKENGKFIPHPATWLNQKRWEDEIEIQNQKTKNTVKSGDETKKYLEEMGL